MTMTTDITTKQYAPRLPKGTFTCLRVNLNATLMSHITAIQNDPRYAVQGSRAPSASLLIRRALTLYLKQLAQMSDVQLLTEVNSLTGQH
ncbi:hypothetical protein [Pseudomonas mediterranea]|uniref:hypothetical protein n=1 Tax=Pseudomonas mediterranea TaxID=183795 RepID=UPI0006D8BBF0|nr:hypothetical protein [Pseudomonas mediterranea]